MSGRPIHIIVAGCGRVGLGGARAICLSGPTAVVRASFLDREAIEAKNAIGLPLLAAHVGEPKDEALAALATGWRPGLRTEALHGDAEAVDWPRLIGTDRRWMSFVLVGLDNWESRMAVARRLREVREGGGIEVFSAQGGLDRGMCQLSVSDNRYGSACPCCGLPSGALPGAEACLQFGAGGELVRGDMVAEAGEAGRLAAEVLCDLARHGVESRWINTTTHAARDPAGAAWRRFTRPTAANPACFGPHGPDRRVSLAGLLATVEEGGIAG